MRLIRKTWTWKATLQEGASFTGSRVLTLLIEQGGLLLLVGSFKMDEMLAKVFLAVIVVILNYVFSKLWVFVQRDNKK
jgi:putative flippase GtrA